MENIKNVLVPTDFSANAWQAILMGIRVSLFNKSNLHLVHINTQCDQDYQDEITEKLHHISDNLSNIYSLKVNCHVMGGEPTEMINSMIEKEHVDLVVMGKNGSSSNEVGSMTEGLLKNLHCPVMIVPPALMI